MIEELKNEQYLILEQTFPNVFKNSLISDLIINNPFTKFYVLKKNNNIIGFINYDLIYDRVEIININILKEFQGKGYGNQLLEFVINNLSKNVKNITLEVNVNNIIAISLYKSHNFVEKAIRKNYYNGTDAILMEREMI